MMKDLLSKSGFKKEPKRVDAPLTAFTSKTLTTASKNLLPLAGDWTGQNAPGIPLQGRRGQLAFWTPFDGFCIPGERPSSSSGNFNFFLAGARASGKSFFCKEMLVQTLSMGGKVVVFETGGHYRHLCLSLGGKRLSFQEEAVSPNPFSLIPTGETREEEWIRSNLFLGLRCLVHYMVFPSGKRTDPQDALIREAIVTAWEDRKNQATLRDVQQALQGREEKEAQEMAESLAAFTENGGAASLFTAPRPLDLSEDFLLLKADANDTMTPLKVMAVMLQLWGRLLTSDTKTPYLILMDDAEGLLQGAAIADFIEAFAGVCRLYRCSLGVVARSSDGDTAALRRASEESAWHVFFHMGEEGLETLKEKPFLEGFVRKGYREALLRSLSPVRGFSEFALFHHTVPGVPLRFFCDPDTRALYETKTDSLSSQGEEKEECLGLSCVPNKSLDQGEQTCA